MTFVPKSSLSALMASKPPGPEGKMHKAGHHNRLPPFSPGPLGKNDKHEALAHGAMASLPELAAADAMQGAAAAIDPLRKAVTYR